MEGVVATVIHGLRSEPTSMVTRTTTERRVLSDEQIRLSPLAGRVEVPTRVIDETTCEAAVCTSVRVDEARSRVTR
jgi:hypothetical protein